MKGAKDRALGSSIFMRQMKEGRRMWEGTVEREAVEVRGNQERQRCGGQRGGTFQKHRVVKKVKVSKVK